MANTVDELLNEFGGKIKLLTPGEIIGEQNIRLLRQTLEIHFQGSLNPGEAVALMFSPEHPGGVPVKVAWPA